MARRSADRAAVTAPLSRERTVKVHMKLYFVPTDNQGRGGWRELPHDRVHTAVLKRDDEPVGTPLYLAKGWVPVEQATPEQLALLSEPERRRHGLRPAAKKGDLLSELAG